MQNNHHLSYSPVPSVLYNCVIEVVDSYKYLGFELSVSFDPEVQWTKVRSKVSSTEFLLKQLKLNGWSTSMLVTAYRAFFKNSYNYCVTKQKPQKGSRASQIYNTSQQPVNIQQTVPSYVNTLQTQPTIAQQVNFAQQCKRSRCTDKQA
jgi:hypothetical protein